MVIVRGYFSGTNKQQKSQAAAVKAAANAAANAGTTTPPQAQTPTSGSLPQGPYTSSSVATSSAPTTASGAPATSMPYAMSTPAQADMQRPQSTSQGQDPNGNTQWGMHGQRSQPMMYHQGSNNDHFAMQQGGDEKRVGHMGDEWNQMFPGGADQQYMNPVSFGYGQEQKNGSHEGGANGYYLPPTSLGANPDGTLGPPLWKLSLFEDDPLRSKSKQLIDFVFPQEMLHERQNNASLQAYLSPQAITRFSSVYVNSLGQHLPWLHTPTFNPLHVYDGLLGVIVCGGALYSEGVSQSEVRSLLSFVQQGIHRTARIHRYMGQYNAQYRYAASPSDIEEFYSLHLLHGLQIWHGSPEERQPARDAMKELMLLTRLFSLDRLAAPDQHDACSYVHCAHEREQLDVVQFNWHTWIEQEKRIRLMCLMLLADSALCLYWNMDPMFDFSSLRLPLPADDAAFEAPNAEACARALGLYGPEAQSKANSTGCSRSHSIDFATTLHALRDPSVEIPLRHTNVYSKFILIHALHNELWLLQRKRSLEGITSGEEDSRSIVMALKCWKQCWDKDIALQYPQTHDMDGPQRTGFCRDGIHFWFLAKALLQPNRMHDWKLGADQKLQLMMKGLSQAKQWSISDAARRGEEPGSVALMDDDYASSDTLVLDMRKLFRPLSN